MIEQTAINPWGLSRMSEFEIASHQELGSGTATHPSPAVGRTGDGDPAPDSDNGYDGDRD